MRLDSDQQAILDQETAALDRWAAGDPQGFGAALRPAPDCSYMDSIGAWNRVDGRDAFAGYLGMLDGKIPEHRYDLKDVRVQMAGDVGILTFRYMPSLLDGTPSQGWKATSVYRRTDDGWESLHAHWSLYAPPEE
jgi:ketosteroid isomerase-like protein